VIIRKRIVDDLRPSTEIGRSEFDLCPAPLRCQLDLDGKLSLCPHISERQPNIRTRANERNEKLKIGRNKVGG